MRCIIWSGWRYWARTKSPMMRFRNKVRTSGRSATTTAAVCVCPTTARCGRTRDTSPGIASIVFWAPDHFGHWSFVIRRLRPATGFHVRFGFHPCLIRVPSVAHRSLPAQSFEIEGWRIGVCMAFGQSITGTAALLLGSFPRLRCSWPLAKKAHAGPEGDHLVRDLPNGLGGFGRREGDCGV